MAKEQTKEEPADAVREPDSFPLTVDEFCARLSATDTRVELIGAFHYFVKASGNVKDLESSFRDRYEAFVNSPA